MFRLLKVENRKRTNCMRIYKFIQQRDVQNKRHFLFKLLEEVVMVELFLYCKDDVTGHVFDVED